MLIRFCGAASEVTGSCHYVEADGVRFLMDCGLFQGGGKQFERNDVPFPFDPKALDFVLLSHTHVDHIGRVPLLVKRGFRGQILSTTATLDLAAILLRDSAHIQEEDAAWKIKRLRKRGQDASWVKTLYDATHAERAIAMFRPVEYDQDVPLDGRVVARWHDAGHVLGSAHVQVTVRHNGSPRKLVFSGDVGNRETAIIKDPTRIARADYLLTESTYGDRLHHNRPQRGDELRRVVSETIRRGGKVIIPAFAVERTQEILYALQPMARAGELRGAPVFVDSPMAVRATAVFKQHAGIYDVEAAAMIRRGEDPFDFAGLRLVSDVEESKSINDLAGPCVIISANGMCTAGRIKHHLKAHIGDPKNTVVFVGYQAKGSLGRQIRDGERRVRIFGEMCEVLAAVKPIEGYSAHADRDGLLWWADGFESPPRKVFVIHGEADVSRSYARLLADRKGWTAVAPKLGEEFNLD